MLLNHLGAYFNICRVKKINLIFLKDCKFYNKLINLIHNYYLYIDCLNIINLSHNFYININTYKELYIVNLIILNI